MNETLREITFQNPAEHRAAEGGVQSAGVRVELGELRHHRPQVVEVVEVVGIKKRAAAGSVGSDHGHPNIERAAEILRILMNRVRESAGINRLETENERVLQRKLSQ